LGDFGEGDWHPVLNEDLAQLLTCAVVNKTGGLHPLHSLKVKGTGLGRKLCNNPYIDTQTGKGTDRDDKQERKKPEPSKPRFFTASIFFFPTVTMTCDRLYFP
jgi:hypothetical protein